MEEDVEVPIAVAELQRNTEYDVGQRRAEVSTVGVCNLVVAVEVLEAEVARTGRLVGVVLADFVLSRCTHFVHGVENTVGNVAVEATDRHAYVGLGNVCLDAAVANPTAPDRFVAGAKAGNLVLYVREVEADVEAEFAE